MVSAALVLIITAAFVMYYYFVKTDKRMDKFPSGPFGLPILGNALQLGKEPHNVFTKWSEKYGPTIGIKLGRDRAVVLHDVKMIREIMNEPVFSGKPQGELFLIFSGGNYGVLNAQGPNWEAQRRFTLRHLRDFGFGKNSMELLIMEEVRETIDWMKKEEGQPLSLNRRFTLAVLNSLWLILSGKRFDQQDNTLNDLLDNSKDVFNEVSSNGLLLFVPWISKFAPEITGYNKLFKTIDDLISFFKQTITEHEFNNEDQPNDFMECYMQEVKKTTDENSSFYKESGEKNLLAIIGDLFHAGTETTSTALAWVILYLLRKQEVQTKLQEEIDLVVGKSRPPSLSDRTKMPYTEAVLMELLRHSSMVPTGVFHTTLYDTEFNGFFFPKGTWVVPNMHAIHHSKDIWGDPENFRPERFIQNGKLISKPDAFMPFQTGKRACIGETLARDTLFLFTTNIFQRFKMSADPANPEPTLYPQSGFLLAPAPYTVILKDRLEI